MFSEIGYIVFLLLALPYIESGEYISYLFILPLTLNKKGVDLALIQLISRNQITSYDLVNCSQRLKGI